MTVVFSLQQNQSSHQNAHYIVAFSKSSVDVELHLHKASLNPALKVMTARLNAIQTFVGNESLWSQNDGTLFVRYLYILVISDMIISKLL